MVRSVLVSTYDRRESPPVCHVREGGVLKVISVVFETTSSARL